MIKENVEFKCVVPNRGIEEKIAKALYEKGLVPGSMLASIGACFMMFHSEGLSANSDAVKFCQWPQLLVSWQQALDLIATVEKPAPVFEFKEFDKILRRKAPRSQWEIGLYSHLHPHENYFVGLNNTTIPQLVKFEGNETLRGSTNAPMGWWEVGNGKPKWATLK